MPSGARRLLLSRLGRLATSVSPAILALVLAACGARDVSSPAALRLLDGGERLTASGPPLPAELGTSSPPPQIGALQTPGLVTRVRMAREGRRGYDARVAMLAGAGTEYRFGLRVPKSAALRVGLGHPLPAAGEPARRARFRIAVETSPGAAPRRLLDESLAVRAENEWADHELPLAEWAGDEVTLVFSADVEPGQVAAWSAPEVVTPGDEQRGWDVVLVSLDTLRADHLGGYGYHRPTSPHLDALAREGILFRAAIAQAPWTRPSHLSLFTSLYPVDAAQPKSPTLAELLWRHGYRTTALTGAGQIDYRFDVFQRGFESYRASRWNENPGWVTDLLAGGRSRNELLFLHTYQVHDPYQEPEFTAGLPRGRVGASFGKQDWNQLRHRLDPAEQRYVTALYDGGVALADRQVGEVVEQLRRAGLLDRVILVVTSDHGEQLWDHGSWRHGQNMYEHQLHVPLIVRLPPPLARQLAAKAGRRDLAGLVVERQVQLIDLYPTLADLLGVPLPAGLRGRSLRPLLEAQPAKELEREAFAENTNIGTWERKAIRTERFKFIVSIPRGAARKKRLQRYHELYDLRRDPGEKVNLAQQHPQIVAFLDQRLRAIRQHEGAEGLQDDLPDNVDAELAAQLRALGYGN